MVSSAFKDNNVIPKYEILEGPEHELGSYRNPDFRRIRALRSFGDVKAGDIGGYVLGDDILSHDGDCWIYDDAQVGEGSVVRDNAKVRGNARFFHCLVEDNADICETSELGSSQCSGHWSGKTTRCYRGSKMFPTKNGDRVHDNVSWTVDGATPGFDKNADYSDLPPLLRECLESARVGREEERERKRKRLKANARRCMPRWRR